MSNFIHPCPNAKVTSPFGWRTIGGVKEWHQGVDLAQSGNVPILASADGVVRDIWGATVSSYGNVIFLQHTINGKRKDTTYAHLKSFNVKKGDKVKQGQIIGYMGNTGRSTGQHLHFEIHDGPWLSGQPNAVDPLKFIMPNRDKKTSKDGIQFIANAEGFYDKTYDDKQPKVKLTKDTKILGTLTIGYGTTKWEDGTPVKIGQTITKEKALALLEKQVEEHCSEFKNHITVALNKNQFDALASFSYNCGKFAITSNSSMLDALNSKQWDKAMAQLKLYNKSNNVLLQGLVNRRNKEVELFNKPVTTKTTETKKKTVRMLYLPKTATSWKVYPTNKAPVKGNEKGYLNPKKFGGLSYEILGNPQTDVYTIQTANFGKVNIYAAKSTGATIKTVEKK